MLASFFWFRFRLNHFRTTFDTSFFECLKIYSSFLPLDATSDAKTIRKMISVFISARPSCGKSFRGIMKKYAAIERAYTANSSSYP